MIRNEVARDALNWSSLKPAWADRLSFMEGFLVSFHVKEKDEKCKRQKHSGPSSPGCAMFSWLIKKVQQRNNNLLSVSSQKEQRESRRSSWFLLMAYKCAHVLQQEALPTQPSLV